MTSDWKKNVTRTGIVCALAMACAPVVANATTLFQDDFDTAASQNRYDQFVFDQTGGNDASATFNFNYGAFHTWYTDLGGNIVSRLIPQAPHTTNGTSIGLRMDANNIPDATTPNKAVINLFPKLAQYAGGTLPSGDYKMTVDVWMNYNGPFEGGVGSTEHMVMGLNQTGGGVTAGSPVTPPTGNHPGLGWTINGERGNAFDYRYWQGSTRIGGTDALDPEVGQVAQDEGPGLPGPADGRNQFYQDAFPFTNPNDPNDIWYETPGSIGKHWTTLEMKYEDGIIYHYATPEGAAAPILIAARTDDSAISGHVMLGYADLNDGTAAAETGDGSTIPPQEQDASFVVFDNLLVESVSQTRQKWNFNGSGSWTDAHWDNGQPNDVTAVADFTTPLSAPATISVNSDQTVRSILFNSANGYTLNGTGTIHLDSLTTGIFGTLIVKQGSHTIDAPVIAARPTLFQMGDGSALTVNNFDSGGFRVVKNGAGVASVNNLRAPSVTVNAGTMRIIPNGTASGVSLLGAVNIATGAKLDISDNKMIVPATIDTTAGTTTYAIGDWDGTAGHYTGLSGLIESGRDTGSGIVTGTSTGPNDKLHSIGIAKVSDLHNGLSDTDTATFAGQTVLGSDTVVMATYGGDANLDGKINIDDYGLIDSHVGQSGTVFGWHNGDFNYDGKINIDDYGIIDGNIGAQGTPIPTAGSALSGVSAVPEPAALGLLAVVGAGLLRRRRPR
jgi:hypothetical protein